MILAVTALVAASGLSGCGPRKQVRQLRSDSVAAEGDIFIWANTVVHFQKDSVRGGGELGPDANNRALQQARARLKEAWDRRDADAKALAKLR